MKVLIVGDTHHKNDNYFKLLKMHHPDMVIHCGDVEGCEKEIIGAADCPVKMVSGNNDCFSDLPKELEFDIGFYRVWLLHGHTYFLYMGNERLKKEAVARRKDIVIYGHTHHPLVETEGKVIALNPGSLTYPRQSGHRPSYIILEMDESDELHFTIAYL